VAYTCALRGSSPTRRISRSCSACNSITDWDGATAATSARRFAATNDCKPSSRNSKILAPHLAEQPGDLRAMSSSTSPMKPQRHVIILRINPARARQPAAQERQHSPMLSVFPDP
jgi:hypothetical protein